MTAKDLRELQLLELDILIEVDNFCQKNNIKYFLGEGTLLGAVRHKGFIPWDDDIDILMLRDDFDKFIKTFGNEKYRVEYFNTMKKWWLPFAKVRMLKETRFSTPQISKISKHTGPRIDVMPLDYVPKEYSKSQKLQGKKIKLLKSVLRNKVLPIGKKIKLYSYFGMIFSKMLPYKYIVKSLNKTLKRYSDMECNYVCNFTGDYDIKKETFQKNMFDSQKYVKFENIELPISEYYDEMLTKIYGDYMKLPPIEKRVVKHNVIVKE